MSAGGGVMSCLPPANQEEEGDQDMQEYDWEGAEDFVNKPYLPPASDCQGTKTAFGENLEPHFWVPRRLQEKPYELIEAANDWHYAMINDHERNVFYHEALRQAITPDSYVLEIGCGSGLLSIMAASLGAGKVVAIEANRHLAAVATQIIQQNGYSDKIRIINKLSTDVYPEDLGPELPDVLVSEILGTLLLGESALHYVQDARQRLLAPQAAILPRAGSQFATLIESEDLVSVTSVKQWQGIDLSWFNSLQDTTSLVFTKQYGFRFSSIKHKVVAPRVPILKVDFSKDMVGMWPRERRYPVQATREGRVHAVLCTWEVYADKEHTQVMSTEPEATRNNFPRDMQWGQGLQLVEDHTAEGEQPVPFEVHEGEWVDIVTRFSSDGVTVQFTLERRGAPPPSPQEVSKVANPPQENGDTE